MKYTKEELIKWHNSKTDTYSLNPKSNRKIKNYGPTYKKLEEEYNILIKEIDNIGENIKTINIKNINNIENKIVLYLELKDTKKIKIYDYIILNKKEYLNGCSCNEKTEIKDDILNILEIINKEYNN